MTLSRNSSEVLSRLLRVQDFPGLWRYCLRHKVALEELVIPSSLTPEERAQTERAFDRIRALGGYGALLTKKGDKVHVVGRLKRPAYLGAGSHHLWVLFCKHGPRRQLKFGEVRAIDPMEPLCGHCERALRTKGHKI